MKQEIANLWADDLESGNFTQTTGALHRTEADEDNPVGYCCLGVLCETAIKNGVPLSVRPGAGSTYYDDTTAFLPSKVAEWAGVDDESIYFDVTDIVDDIKGSDVYILVLKDGRKIASAVDLNDGKVLDFKGIAKLVRDGKIYGGLPSVEDRSESFFA